MKILHAADLHLDSPLRGLSGEGPVNGVDEPGLAARVRGASRAALCRLIDLALEEEVKVLLLAGDLFDGTWRDHQTGIFFTQQLARLTQSGARALLVRGNHDADSKMAHHVTLPTGAHLFGHGAPSTVDLPELGLAIHGWSYPVGAVSEDPTPRFPAPIAGRVNIGLLHTNLGGQSGHSDYAPTTVSGLVARGYDYWALGHIHQRAHLENSGVHIVYPGNLQARHINEAGGPEGKGATLITVERGAIQRVEHRAVDVLRWAQITADVTGTAHFDDAVRHLQARVSEALAQAQLPTVLRVDVVGKTVAHGGLTARTQDLLASLKAGLPQHVALYVERLRVQTEAPTVEGIDPLADLVSKIAEHLRTTPDAQAAMRAELRRELEPILHKTHDNELLAEARSLVEGDALDALLAEATTTLLHRLRG